MMSQDLITFVRAWLADPRAVGAVAPSGPALAELITREVDATSGPVIELGPGTGTFTRALLARGLREESLTLVEHDAGFARLLRLRFPAARVLGVDAARLVECRLFDDAPAGAIVSGLPLLNLPPRKIIAILAGAFRYGRPGCAFYQFTYGTRCPVPRPFLDRLGLRATLVGRALLNVPPAAVYRITRRGPPRFTTN
jgi:phospholipid N-methyltransferase